MSQIFGANNDPLVSFLIAPDTPVRHYWWWDNPSDTPAESHGFAILPSIRTLANRVISYDNAIELNHRDHPAGMFTVDVRCENVLQSGDFGAYRILIGQLQ
jgi:hypothetical protein